MNIDKIKSLMFDISLEPYCNDVDDVFCLCKGCKENKINGGNCTHCFTCINNEKSMDICDCYNCIM